MVVTGFSAVCFLPLLFLSACHLRFDTRYYAFAHFERKDCAPHSIVMSIVIIVMLYDYVPVSAFHLKLH